MGRLRALVIGGTGPTGPVVVEGLHRRGYEVSILHGGQHEVDFAVPDVEHIHADPHFEHTLSTAIGRRMFDLVVAQYGRLRVVSSVFRHKTERLIAIGAATALYAGDRDERWGGFGKPAIVPDTSEVFVRSAGDGIDAFGRGSLNLKMVEAVQSLFEHHASGAYAATYLGYPVIYGPRQPGPNEWCVIRRVLDGRKTFVITDGGLRLESRLFSENAAAAALAIVDAPDVVAGKRYSVADRYLFTMKRRVEFIAAYLGHEFEFVDIPFEHAWPCHPFYRRYRDHWLCDSSSIRNDLGYQDPVAAETAMQKTVDWLVANRPQAGGELEQQIGDPFAYDQEDQLIDRWKKARRQLEEAGSALPSDYRHFYRHPQAPDERWAKS